MMCQSIGRPPISTIGFGFTSVSSTRRVPTPPARMATFMNGPPSRGPRSATPVEPPYTPQDLSADPDQVLAHPGPVPVGSHPPGQVQIAACSIEPAQRRLSDARVGLG